MTRRRPILRIHDGSRRIIALGSRLRHPASGPFSHVLGVISSNCHFFLIQPELQFPWKEGKLEGRRYLRTTFLINYSYTKADTILQPGFRIPWCIRKECILYVGPAKISLDPSANQDPMCILPGPCEFTCFRYTRCAYNAPGETWGF